MLQVIYVLHDTLHVNVLAVAQPHTCVQVHICHECMQQGCNFGYATQSYKFIWVVAWQNQIVAHSSVWHTHADNCIYLKISRDSKIYTHL